MAEQDERFAAQVRAFHRRVIRLVIERTICWAIAVAGALAVLLVTIDLLSEWYITPIELGALALIGALTGAIYTRMHRVSALAVAITVDKRLQLKERMSSALALANDIRVDPEFSELITADASTLLTTHRPSDVFPWKFGRHHQAMLAVWVVAVGLFLLPALPWWYTAQETAARQSLHDTGIVLQQQAEHLHKNPAAQKNEIARRVALNMRRLGVEMEKNRISKREALKRLNKLLPQLEKAEEAIARERERQTAEGMKAAADAVNSALEARSAAEKQAAARAREKLSAGVSRNQLSAEERQALEREALLQKLTEQMTNNDMTGAKESLRKLARQLQQQPLSPQERQRLSKALKQMSNAAKNSPDTAGKLKRAADALGKNSQSGQQQAGDELADLPPGKESDLGAMKELVESTRQQIAANQSGDGNGNTPGSNGANPGGGNGTKPTSGHDVGPHGGAPNTGGTSKPGPALPYRAGGEAYDTHAPKNKDKSGTAGFIEVRGEPGKVNHTTVPYYEVYQEYRTRAETAVDARAVPPSEQRRVKDYFNALDPSSE